MQLSFCAVESKYCDFLRENDLCVPYTYDEKQIRPFVGVVFSFNEFNYYAPLTSPKKKHKQMKNQIDFIKINNGKWGAINFNNMIPVPEHCLIKVVMQILDTDSIEEIRYKNLLTNQLIWCKAHKEEIIKKAKNLYSIVVNNKAWDELRLRCCNFLENEKQCLFYSQHKEIRKAL